MKILIYSPLALENGRGGEISSIELAAGLNNYYPVSLIDSNRVIGEPLLSKKTINKKLKGLEKSNRINYFTLHVFNRNFSFPNPREILKLFREVKRNDIIYTTLFNTTNIFLFILFSIMHKKAKFIVGFRKPLTSDKFLSLYNIKYRFSILLLTVFRKQFYIHTISNHAKKFLDNFYKPNRVNHIIHGVELEDYQQNETNEKSKDVLNFIYVGHLDDVHKGVGVLVDAIRIILEEKSNIPIYFEFCGRGPLEQKISELESDYPKYIKYHGYVNTDIVHEYYKKSDIFLFTSRREPFGRVLIEALAAKLLIICTNTFGSIEILKNKEFAFFLDDLKSENLRNKIDLLYKVWREDPNKFRQLQQLAKDYAFKNYSFSVELEMFKNLIEDLKSGRV
ncbi:MAG: glycosyltransferase family 4 protein [Candidatus Lokiarchaeota archaeon]|nr:glycosyltransferase family 4 protein [Candidatus Lokiarchaeota archaeon]